jgi:hypothetical protein
MSDSAVAGATHTGKELGSVAMRTVVDVFVPLGAGIAGFVGGATILGGAQAMANVVYNALGGSGSGATANRVGGFIFAIIWGGLGYTLYHMGKSGGLIMRAICGGAGGFFLGTAANLAIFNALLGRQPQSSGLVDRLFGLVGTVATGGSA